MYVIYVIFSKQQPQKKPNLIVNKIIKGLKVYIMNLNFTEIQTKVNNNLMKKIYENTKERQF